MPNQIDNLMALKGKKVVDFNLVWDDGLDDFWLEYIEFEDGTFLSLVGDHQKYIVRWFLENGHP